MANQSRQFILYTQLVKAIDKKDLLNIKRIDKEINLLLSKQKISKETIANKRLLKN